MTRPTLLSFREVDGLGFAAANDIDLSQLPGQYAPDSLGPLLELHHLTACGRLPTVFTTEGRLVSNGAAPLISALHNGSEMWTSPNSHRMGFIRAVRNGTTADNMLYSFLMNAQTAAREIAGLPGRAPNQLAAAMEEMENNIHEHSEASETGILAFRAAAGVFEFVALDRGIGVLSSLRQCTVYASLPDHGKALKAALTEGTSRYGPDSQRGNGFRPMFLGLANLQSSLRFRSGDHALVIDGSSPTIATSQLLQKPILDGFFVSIRCEAPRK